MRVVIERDPCASWLQRRAEPLHGDVEVDGEEGREEQRYSAESSAVERAVVIGWHGDERSLPGFLDKAAVHFSNACAVEAGFGSADALTSFARIQRLEIAHERIAPHTQRAECFSCHCYVFPPRSAQASAIGEA
jgi:hypothetical protein